MIFKYVYYYRSSNPLSYKGVLASLSKVINIDSKQEGLGDKDEGLRL